MTEYWKCLTGFSIVSLDNFTIRIGKIGSDKTLLAQMERLKVLKKFQSLKADVQ